MRLVSPSRIRVVRAVSVVVAAVVGALGCVDNPPEMSELDPAFFRCRVQPIFDLSCSALACHGDGRRAFHVFTRNRMRLVGTNAERILPLTEDEVSANFDNARGFAETPPEASLLLLKPLEQGAGGYFHLGKDRFEGEDVWTTRDDADYQTLLAWLRGEIADPTCVYAGFR